MTLSSWFCYLKVLYLNTEWAAKKSSQVILFDRFKATIIKQSLSNVKVASPPATSASQLYVTGDFVRFVSQSINRARNSAWHIGTTQ